MRDKIKEQAVNVRKIQLSVEVAFWNVVIAFLTVFKDVRAFSQTSPASMPALRRTNPDQLISNPYKLIIRKVMIHRQDLYKIAIKASFWAMLGFVIGFLLGFLTG